MYIIKYIHRIQKDIEIEVKYYRISLLIDTIKYPKFLEWHTRFLNYDDIITNAQS